MITIYLATANSCKVEEISGIFKATDLNVEILSAMAAGGMPEVLETEDSFIGNAKLKAKALKNKAPQDAWILADDSGLIVDALRGKPGIHSSRYAGSNADDEKNNRKLLSELKGINEAKRSARFFCALVLSGPGGIEKVFRGNCEGFITDEPAGNEGFGYDPLFMPNGYGQTFGELGESVKSKMSHRATALKELVSWLKERKE